MVTLLMVLMVQSSIPARNYLLFSLHISPTNIYCTGSYYKDSLLKEF